MIEQKGADGVRFGTLICSPAGNDLIFDDKAVEQGRNFCNKLWNALRLLKGWTIDDTLTADTLAGDWFSAKMNETIVELEKNFNNYTISEALKILYSLIWDDFCAWYLEMIKPEFGQPISKAVFDRTTGFFEQLMKLLHPFMPFITEEIYQSLKERPHKDFITIAQYPIAKSFDKKLIADFDRAKDIVMKVREYRNKNNVKPKEGLKLFAAAELNSLQKFHSIISKQANLLSFSQTATEPANAYSFLVGAEKFFIASDNKIDAAQERVRLTKELEAAQNLLQSTQAKLNNEKFISNAKPDLVTREKQKLADAETRISSIEASLKQLVMED
jgi:valyl-tRNA synthetase